MTMAFNPFSEEGRRNRLSGPKPYSQYPGGASVNPDAVPVANPDPVMADVSSLPNQINLDESVAYPINEAFLDYYKDRDDSGLGWLDTPAPFMTWQEERDNSGDFVSRGLQADWSGVDEPVRNLQQFYAEPLIGRANRSIYDENLNRELVRNAMNPADLAYQTEREVRNVDPLTGRSYSTFVPETRYQPFFPVESLYI